VRIATWNINGLRARMDFVLAWLAAREPDVVGLQELKLTDDNLPADAFAEAGYHVASHGQKAWNGVAILSREPARVVQRGLPGQEDFGARLITAEVGDLAFTTVYCPNGKSVDHDDYPRKLAWFDALLEHLEPRGNADAAEVLCGDFNVCPTALDTWDEVRHEGRIFHTDAERERIRALYDRGWVDLYRALRPDERAFSWWDYRGGAFHRKHGLRIDFLLGTRQVAERTEAVTLDRDWRKKHDGLTPSDHCPVFADLR
jgi:exodeoxyribonuclease-3